MTFELGLYGQLGVHHVPKRVLRTHASPRYCMEVSLGLIRDPGILLLGQLEYPFVEHLSCAPVV